MRTLIWHYGGLLHAGSHDVQMRRGGAASYTLDRDYEPVEVRLYMGEAPQGSPTTIDIKDDGASIFTDAPQVDQGTVSKVGDTFKTTGQTLLAESVMTLDIKSVGNKGAGSALTVELDIEET